MNTIASYINVVGEVGNKMLSLLRFMEFSCLQVKNLMYTGNQVSHLLGVELKNPYLFHKTNMEKKPMNIMDELQ